MKNIRNAFSTLLTKRLFTALLVVGLAGHLTGCAMGGSSDEEATTGDETFAEESSGDFEDGEVAEGEEAADDGEASEELADSGEELAEGDDLEGEVAEAGEEALEGDDLDVAEGSEGDLVEDEGLDVADAGEDLDDELSLDDEEGLPSDIASNDTGEAPPIIEEPATDAPIFAEPSTDQTSDVPVESFADSGGSEAPMDSGFSAPVEAPTWVPVKKVRTEAFMAGSTNLNRVYVARPGDTVSGIAEKIYGDKSRASDLRSWNGFLSRGSKTGDKIYYSSPTSPTDSNMMTYFEDAGVPAQNYVSRDGDNIREVSKSLLGDNDSWKEIWATNQEIESKGDIPSGLNIRYWPDGAAPAAPIMAQAPDQNPMGDVPPASPDAGSFDPLAQQQPSAGGMDPLSQPPADPLAPNDPVAGMQNGGSDQQYNDPLSAPTGTPASVPPAVGSTEVPPPPMDPPPPPPVQASAPPMDALGGESTEEADNMMMMGLAGIVLLAAGSVFFLMRRSRSRKVDLTQTTQIG